MIRTIASISRFFAPPNAEAQLPPERPKAAEGTRSAPALWAVNCSDLLDAAISGAAILMDAEED